MGKRQSDSDYSSQSDSEDEQIEGGLKMYCILVDCNFCNFSFKMTDKMGFWRPNSGLMTFFQPSKSQKIEVFSLQNAQSTKSNLSELII